MAEPQLPEDAQAGAGAAAALGGFGEWVYHKAKADPGGSPGVVQGVKRGSPMLSHQSCLLLPHPQLLNPRRAAATLDLGELCRPLWDPIGPGEWDQVSSAPSPSLGAVENTAKGPEAAEWEWGWQ